MNRAALESKLASNHRVEKLARSAALAALWVPMNHIICALEAHRGTLLVLGKKSKEEGGKDCGPRLVQYRYVNCSYSPATNTALILIFQTKKPTFKTGLDPGQTVAYLQTSVNP